MRSSQPIALVVYVALVFAPLLMPTPVSAQDYALFQVLRVRALPGHTEDLGERMVEHNQRFHAEGASSATVQALLTGPDGGWTWVMGPTTFAQLDERPSSDAHDQDWADAVLQDGEVLESSYWIVDDDLTYTPSMPTDESRPLSMVRFFEVADVELFQKVQSQIKEVLAARGTSQPRTMLQRQFLNRDGRDWAIVIPYRNWAEYEDSRYNFQEAFIDTFGEGPWASFDEDFDAAVSSREDVWRMLVPGN